MSLSKTGLVTALACTVYGAIFLSCNREVSKVQTRASTGDDAAQTLVYYARHDIPKGMMVNMAFLSMRGISPSKVPTHAATDFRQIDGRVAKNGIAAGSIVSLRDLVTVNPPLEP